MQIYLPITEMAINIFYLIALGGGVGFLSGLLGVSGGFLLTPILILFSIPSSIAVASQSAGVIATSTTGVMEHIRRDNIDFKMAWVVLFGGIIGSSSGIWIFTILKDIGQLDITIKIAYILFLSLVGWLMVWEVARSKWLSYTHRQTRKKLHEHNWVHGLPFRTKFKKSRLYISILLPILIGYFVGFLSALMGVGGGFIMVPAMIYLLGMHTSVVVGTTLFQGIFVAINSTFWQASINHTVDAVLAFILIIGGVIGAKFGAKISTKFQASQLRFILATIVLSVATKLMFDLMITPSELYTISSPRGAW